jgi:hypothetical protein
MTPEVWAFCVKGILASCGVALVGLLLPCKGKRKQPEPELLWSREYRQMYKDCLTYAEQLYQQKK